MLTYYIKKVNNLSKIGVKKASKKQHNDIKNIDTINDNKYLPKNFLKFKLSFFINALKNLMDALTAKIEKNIYIKILIIKHGNK